MATRRVRRQTAKRQGVRSRLIHARRRRLRLEPLEDRRLLAAAPLFVDADSTAAESDGSAWASAYVDLQDALDQAAAINADADDTNDIDAIWIADGLYAPTKDKHNNATPDDPRTATFSMLSGVSLYGGFAGDEETLDDRAKTPENTWLDETILSGDLAGNDVPDDDTLRQENAYTVVYTFDLPGPLTLDALTITAGSADGSWDNLEWQRGAGVYARASDITITNSTLTGNLADDGGGGICLSGGTLAVTNSTLTGNSATYGGGIRNDGGTLAVTSSTITGNSANNHGGGILSGGGTLTVTNSTIAGNSARTGGGIRSSGTLTLTNSTLTGNLADLGGGIDIYRGTLTVTNSTIAGNSADGTGGGIYSYSGTLTVANSTIAGNSASSGGGIYSSGTLTVTNSIVCLNSAHDIWGRFEGSNNLIGIDPGFVRSPSAGTDGVWGTDDDDPGDLRLTDKSPTINRGDNLLAVDADGNPLLTDLTGNPRIADDVVDIGAYEYRGPPAAGREPPLLVVSATHDSFDLYDGDITLREAIYYCQSGIGDGTVTFDAALDGATITLAGSELTIYQSVLIDALALSSLTIDADGRSRAFYVTDNATLRGLTITGGSAVKGGGVYSDGGTLTVTNCTLTENSAASHGGGIFSDSGTLTVADSTITGNSAIYYHGGGIFSGNGTLTVANSTLAGNSARSGGGIYSERGAVTVTNSALTRNSARESGGAIYSRDYTLTVADSTFTGNSAAGTYLLGGGAIFNYGGILTVANCTLTGNSADERGGGIWCYGTLTVANSTFVGNSAIHGNGGGIFTDLATLTVTNSTIAGNSSGRRGGGIYSDRGLIMIHNTIVSGNDAVRLGPDAHGSVTDPSSCNLIGTIGPRFVRNPTDGGDGWGDDPDTPDVDEGANDDYGDLRLLPDSPAIDAGDNARLSADEFDLDGDGDVAEPIPVDLAGNPRIWNGTVDMGAYEYLDTSLLHPGDANFDGVTDLSDFNIWNANKFTDNTAWATADFNGDGLTDLSDFNIWNAQKFTSAPQPAPVVGEPTADDRLWADPAWLDELADTRIERKGLYDVARQNVRALLATYWL